MTDIVERLREHGDCEIKDIGKWVDFASLYLAEAAAEIERLRAALEPLACDCGPGGEKPCHKPENCRNHIARAALEQEKGGQ